MTHRKFICVCACILLLCLQGCTYYARPSSPSSEVLFCKDNYVPIMKYGFSGKRTAFRTQIELFGLSMDPVEDYNCMLNTDGTISDFVYNKDSQYYINQEYSKKIINNLNNGTYGSDLKQWYNSYNDLLRDGEYILEHFGFIRTPESGYVIIGYTYKGNNDSYLLELDTEFDSIINKTKFSIDEAEISGLIDTNNGYIHVYGLIWFDENLTLQNAVPSQIIRQPKETIKKWLYSSGYDHMSDSIDTETTFFYERIDDIVYYSFLAADLDNTEKTSRYCCEFTTSGELLRLVCCRGVGALYVSLLSDKSTITDWYYQ